MAGVLTRSTKRKGLKLGDIVMHHNLDIKRHASKICTRVMFGQFVEMLYKGFAYRVEEIEK